MQTPEFHPIPHLDQKYLPPGEAPRTWTPGDFILVHSHSLSSRLIHLGQRFRIRGDDRRFTWFDHAALIVSDTGDLIEAVGTGVIRSNAEKYRHKHYNIVRVGADPADVKQALQFAEWVADNRARYGVLTIASLGLSLLAGAKLTFFIDGEFICSGLVARAMERTGAIFNRDPVHITPADLAKYYSVNPAHSGSIS
jgi:hypothetical protein